MHLIALFYGVKSMKWMMRKRLSLTTPLIPLYFFLSINVAERKVVSVIYLLLKRLGLKYRR